jgi:hypothetical protein
MSHMLQLNPAIPVITGKGKGEAVGWIDYSKEDDLIWVVFSNDTGECWLVPNDEVRAFPNWTIKRMRDRSSKEVQETIIPGEANLPASLKPRGSAD